MPFRVTRVRVPARKTPKALLYAVKRHKRNPRVRYYFGRDKPMSNPFNSAKFMRLKYFDEYAMTQASSVPVVYQWYLNSLHDFDKTSSGHRPYYYNQLTPMYNQHRVYGVKIAYTLSANADCVVVFRGTSESAAPAATEIGFDTENERPGSKTIAYSSGGPPTRGTVTYSIRKILGYSKQAYNDDDRTASPMTSYPSLLAYLNVVLFSKNSANCTANLLFKVTFLVKMFDPVFPAQS